MVVPERIGDWRIERRLGQGGMGTVLRGHAPGDPDRPVAIKLLDLAWHPEAIARFRREAALLQAVDHPGVVRVLDARLDHEPPYLVMELVEGEDLGHLVGRLGALPVRGALLVASALAQVFAHLHARAIYHRDLKPANVIVAGDHRVKLVDFGIAREEGKARLTEVGHRVGTPAFSPPEWARGDGLPQQWDLYALGALLDHVLTGRDRFPQADDDSVMMHAVKVMAAKAKLECLDPGPEIPQPVREIVKALTARDPARRPQTAREVHHRLQELLRDPVVTASAGLADRSLPGDFESVEDRWLASEESPPRHLPTRRLPTRPLAPRRSLTDSLTTREAMALGATVAALSFLALIAVSVVVAGVTVFISA